jgi:hypothetical protein
LDETTALPAENSDDTATTTVSLLSCALTKFSFGMESDENKKINVEEILSTFHHYQQQISEGDTKIMQLKIAKKYKGA